MAEFIRADLRGSQFEHADLSGAQFGATDLTGGIPTGPRFPPGPMAGNDRRNCGLAAWSNGPLLGTFLAHNPTGAPMGARTRRAAALVAVAAAMAAAGCGSSVHLNGTAAPPPGHQAPANAVSGFAQHLLAGDDPVITCSYVDPDEKGNCYSGLGDVHGGSGTWRLGHSVEHGNKAIVAVELDRVCFSSCTTSVSPDAGLPRHGESFGTAFQHTQDGSRDSGLGCIRIGGRWYVELSISGLL